MDHTDHLALIRDGIPAPGGVWADFGSGQGAFTLALAELLGPGGSIWSVDRDARALREQAAALRARYPGVALETVVGDFGRGLPLPTLDGAICANSLHFLAPAQRDAALGHLRRYLRPGGHLIVVEYDTDAGNRWVPHPFSFATWSTIASRAGFADTHLLKRRPARFLGAIYSALSVRPDDE